MTPASLATLTQLFFDTCIFACEWLGWFTPAALEIQLRIWQIAHILGIPVTMRVG